MLRGAFLGILGVVLLAVQRRYNAAGHTHKICTKYAYAAFNGYLSITKIDVAPLHAFIVVFCTIIGITKVHNTENGQL